MRTNCNEVNEKSELTWSATEILTFGKALEYLKAGDKNIVCYENEDSNEYKSVEGIDELFSYDVLGFEFAKVHYYERQ